MSALPSTENAVARPGRNTPSMLFFRDPDQPARREELRLFFGPHADRYLPVYDRLQAIATRPPGTFPRISFLQNGFSGPAFFVGPVWFFYRRMWVYGAVITGILVVLAFLPLGRLSLPVSLAIALSAKQLYVSHAISTLQKLRGASGAAVPAPPLDPARIAEAGGVSPTAGWIGGIIYGLLVLLGIAGIVYLIKTGQPLS